MWWHHLHTGPHSIILQQKCGLPIVRWVWIILCIQIRGYIEYASSQSKNWKVTSRKYKVIQTIKNTMLYFI